EDAGVQIIGVGVVGVLVKARGEEHHVGLQVLVPVGFRCPGHSGLGLVHHDAGVLFVGAVPVHQVSRFPHLDLQAALGLCFAPAGAAADAQVGGQHVVLIAVVGADDVGVAQSSGVRRGDHS